MNAVIVTGIILLRALKKGQVTTSGALAATMMGLVLTLANYFFMAIMIAFFIVGSAATKLKSDVKKAFDPEYKTSGGRDWVQVLCNGGIATQCALIYLIHHGPGEENILTEDSFSAKLMVALIASISCVFGDTLSSEIGSGFAKGDPLLITTFKQVPRGTNGAVSFIGLISSVFAGLIVTIIYSLCDLFLFSSLNRIERVTLVTVISIASSLGGSLLDSLLGASLQFTGKNVKSGKITEIHGPSVKRISGFAFFDNHAVNFVSCLICTILAPGIIK